MVLQVIVRSLSLAAGTCEKEAASGGRYLSPELGAFVYV